MAEPKQRRGRAWLVTLLKVMVAVVILWLLLREVDLCVLGRHLAGASKALLLLGLVLNIGTVLIAGKRWQILLRVVGLPVRWLRLTGIAFIGQFFATFLPGPLGDDLTRMVYIARVAGKRMPVALSSVVLDRVVGLSVILLLAVFVMPPHRAVLGHNSQTALLGAGIMVGGAAVALGLLFFFALPVGILRYVGGIFIRFVPEGHWRQQADRFLVGYLGHRRSLAAVFGLALATQVTLCLMYEIAGRAVGIQLPLAAWLGFVPVVLVANALPVTVAGLGIREYLMVLFLGVLGAVSEEQALACSFAVLAMMLMTNLCGGLVYLFLRLPSQKTEPAF